ncbi:hypothetical protein DL766_006957 [Monosporascus sp. MC13-8B]|uniref:Nucleotide exchange factor Fes1 domain-containing protein n=1 Tax=Monosporascus cannonballus TaxID=155416 RepID=A0ABY0GZ85_9PEZI|nr:hypothetical protein DL762_008933 [Monosporascus cannonballus]RYO79898.1 hypothetical protein DL763_009116 [Monosporascus cannonballus]RYP25632.1 hypothetical protein DL766_006957 [Monosporascus sp. MC13-8B]
MAQNKSLNELLKWSIENSTTPQSNPVPDSAPNDTNGAAAQQTSTTGAAPRNLDPELLAQLLGGPSDAELMQAAVEHATSQDPEITLESRLTALDNLEQLVESLDNANLLSKLGLWTPLLGLLGHGEARVRLMATWCVATAVQNNAPCQERLVALGGVERLVAMALGERAPAPAEEEGEEAGEEGRQKQREGGSDATAAIGDAETATGTRNEEDKDVRRKAVYALSCAVRNYQPAMDVCTNELRKKGEHVENIDATDMDAINDVINNLKEKVTKA